jgi:hypothetical protein
MTEPIEQANPTATATTEPPAGPPAPPSGRSRLWRRLLGLALVITSVVLATYLLVAYFAFESGRAERVAQETTARDEQIGRQIELARQDLDAGSSHLAQTRLDWVLAQEPGNADALALREQAAAAEAAVRAPQPTAAARPTAEPTPEEIITDDETLTELQAIRRLVAGEEYEEALPLLVSFQQRFPEYERAETDQLLYNTYLALGLQYVNTEKIEIGLNYFSQAEKLGNLPQEAESYRVWADLYFQGVAYSGVNWSIAADYWADLCAAAPFFRDACVRLDRSLVGIGDQYAFLLDWCPALDAYQRAWNRQPTDALGAKVAQAREGCAAATPVPISGTLPITGTAPLTPTEPGG